MNSTPSPSGHDEAYREYARKMRLLEEGPTTTNFEQLIARGVELPEPDTIPDDRINSKLWDVIRALADIRVFLDYTDHLSDRELYHRLWHRVLNQEVPAMQTRSVSTNTSTSPSPVEMIGASSIFAITRMRTTVWRGPGTSRMTQFLSTRGFHLTIGTVCCLSRSANAVS